MTFLSVVSELSIQQLAVLSFCALLVGINKTAIPGLGILPVVLLTLFFDPKLSLGLQLGMIAMADIMAVTYYRRSADWKILLRLLPWGMVGIAAGAGFLCWFIPSNDLFMRKGIGIFVLMLILMGEIHKRISPDKIPLSPVFSAVFGILFGIFTQLANAAGPIASVYFLSLRLPKEKMLGCCAWTFLILNWTKVPIFWLEGRITLRSVILDCWMIPLLLLGAWLGILLQKRISRTLFEKIVLLLAAAASIKLAF